MKLELPKGTRDFLPEEKLLRDKIVSEIKQIFELYGFIPLETPVFERYEVLSAKFAAGAESDSLKETFKLTDQGNRQLGLKYDLTVPMARVVAMNPNLKMPFKRYQIERVFRDGPIEKSRYREFLQCDVDIVGCSDMIADAEILALTEKVFEKLNLDVEILLNNRKILTAIMQQLKIKKDLWEKTIITVDKLNKFGSSQVQKELKELKLNNEQIKSLLTFIELSGSNEEKLEKISDLLDDKTGIEDLKAIINYCSLFSLKNIKIDFSLARGLAYYTGPIFEVILIKGKVKSSIAGGGRFDKMIGLFANDKKEFPATGISFGIERIFDELKEQKIQIKAITKVYVIPINTLKESLEIIKELRKNNVNTDFDLNSRNISKNLDYANKLNIQYVIFIGEKELSQNKVKLRNMQTGKEEFLSVEDLIKKLK